MSYHPEQHMSPSSGIGATMGLWAFAVLGLLALDPGGPRARPEPSLEVLATASRCGPAAAGQADAPAAGPRTTTIQVHAS